MIRSHSDGYCPECRLVRCHGCGKLENPVRQLTDGRWHCGSCHRPAWPDRLAWWQAVAETREHLEAKA